MCTGTKKYDLSEKEIRRIAPAGWFVHLHSEAFGGGCFQPSAEPPDLMRIKFNFVRMKFKIMRIKRESHAREILPFRPKGKKG